VVAERDRVGAGGEQLVGELRGDAHSVRHVLAVDDAEVDLELLAQGREALLDRAPAGGGNNICDEQNSQYGLRM